MIFKLLTQTFSTRVVFFFINYLQYSSTKQFEYFTAYFHLSVVYTSTSTQVTFLIQYLYFYSSLGLQYFIHLWSSRGFHSVPPTVKPPTRPNSRNESEMVRSTNIYYIYIIYICTSHHLTFIPGVRPGGGLYCRRN